MVSIKVHANLHLCSSKPSGYNLLSGVPSDPKEHMESSVQDIAYTIEHHYIIIIFMHVCTISLVKVFFAEDSSFNMFEAHSISFAVNPIMW